MSIPISALADGPADAVRSAACRAPYLARLVELHPDLLIELARLPPETVFEAILQSVRKVGQVSTEDEAMAALRRAKQRAHLMIAAADLSGQWTLEQVTGAMTRLADDLLSTALKWAADRADIATDGLFIVALGKMGAGELNYSSDVDLAAFYEPDIFTSGRRGPADTAARLLRQVIKLLEERTADGYVLRTDLRLRPDPSSTPLVVSTRMAELYYESVGQNWERMVWIKARGFAGDLDQSNLFLSKLVPFVWRHHLDPPTN